MNNRGRQIYKPEFRTNNPDAFHFEDQYGELKMPVVIIAGEGDRLIDIEKQSPRLHSEVSTERRFIAFPTTVT